MTQTLRLMSTLAVEVAFKRALLPAFEAAGHRIAVSWAPTAVLMERIRAGERADAVVLIDASLDALAEAGIVRGATITPIAQAMFGLGVRAGAPRPDIGSPEAFRDALLSARSVAYSRKGASGIYFAQLIERLGIAEAVNARATLIEAGFVAERLISGEADLAVQQVSELMSVADVEVVGPFPATLQKPTDFSAAIFAEADNSDLAETFLHHLTTPAADAAYRAGGLTSRLARPA